MAATFSDTSDSLPRQSRSRPRCPDCRNPDHASRPDHRQRRRRKKTKRSLTLSPSARDVYGREVRPDWDWDPNPPSFLRPPSTSFSSNRSTSPRRFQKKPQLPNFMRRGILRKTHSEPSDIFSDEVDEEQVEKIQDILRSLNFSKFHVSGPSPGHSLSSLTNFKNDPRSEMTPTPAAKVNEWRIADNAYPSALYTHLPPGHYSGPDLMQTSFSGSEVMTTDIEELKEAAMSIEALSRRNRRGKVGGGASSSTSMETRSEKPAPAPIRGHSAAHSVTEGVEAPNSSTLPRRSGISSRLGAHPRGVIQFLPSVRSSEFLSNTAYESYIASKNKRETRTTAESVSPPDSIDSRLFLSDKEPDRFRPNQPLTINTHMGAIRGDGLNRKSSMPERFYSMVAGDDELGSAPPRLLPPERPKTNRLSRFASFGAMHPSRLNKTPISRHHSTTEQPFSDPETFHHASSSLKGVESLSGFNRFSRMLRSLRTSRANSPENLSPGSSESGLSSPGPPSDPVLHPPALPHPLPSHRPLHQADLLLWRKRSKGSLRRHHMKQMIRRKSSLGPSGSPDRGPRRSLFRFFTFREDDFLACGLVPSSARSATRHSASASSLLPRSPLLGHDTRSHVIRELFDTEASYLESLELMVQKYLRPLKRPELCSLVEPSLVDEMFFQVPEILQHHQFFFGVLKGRLDAAADASTLVGDLLLNFFTKQSVIDTYTSFINNWKNAKRAIRRACQTKPAFAKYLVRCSREHRNKLTLDALLIMPVQRIPRYELLIKGLEELLKHTSMEHPDHRLLQGAAREIHDLAMKIDHVEQETGLSEQMLQRLREIEAIVQGLEDLVSEERVFYRYDLVTVETEGGRKERCIFLFSDQLLITSLKRKAGPALKRTSKDLYPMGHNFLENHKFKLLMKISLDDLEIKGSDSQPLKQIQGEIQELQEDIRVLGKIADLTQHVKIPHSKLDKELGTLVEDGRARLNEKSLELTNNPHLTSLRLFVTTEAGVEGVEARFGSAEKRESWEKAFLEAKEAQALSQSRRPPPEFLRSVPLQKTRPGLHLGPATIAPGFVNVSPTASPVVPHHSTPALWLTNSDADMGQVAILQLAPDPVLGPPTSLATSAVLALCHVPSSRHLPRRRKLSSNMTLHPDPDTISNLALESDSSDNEDVSVVENEDTNPLMWLGTEDGSILVYSCADCIKSKLCRHKVQHSSSVNALAYAEDKVFAALGSGSLIYYEREKDGGWNLVSHSAVELDQCPGPITRLLNVGQKIWAASENLLIVLNAISATPEHSFPVNSDPDTDISSMGTAGLGVWVAMRASPVLKLFHALTYHALLDLNLCPTVTKALAGSDDIIRQHKLSKLGVTALLCGKDQLWVGTSAGVVLTLPLPHLSASTSKPLSAQPPLSVCPMGHVGQCRFLAALDPSLGLLSRTASHSASFSGLSDLGKRRMSLNVAALHQGKVFIVSGGEGLEDMHETQTTEEDDENVGRDDSVNHLLIWHV